RRYKGFPYLLHGNKDLVNIGEALMQGQLLQEAFACEKPDPWIVAPTASFYTKKWHPEKPIVIRQNGDKEGMQSPYTRISFYMRESKNCIRVHATNFFSNWSNKNLQGET
ncbi:UDP-glucose/GDP-mannose dehydrogenase family protein, partial [Sesbania bispinosa]